MKKIYYLLALFILGINSFAFCQGTNTVLQNVTSKLKALSTNHVIQKAYLHFDRPYYAAGDTMYFKAYVTLGDHPDLSKAGEILHVDLINPQNVTIRSIRLQLNKGVTWGDFDLPDTLQGGSYKVRAFTRYMQNEPEYFFTKTIAITSGSNKNAPVNANASAKADIQFFPEGGEMITSLVSKVAFKAIGTNGMGLGVKGVILDNTNTQVATFASTHLGMGSFYIQPIAGKTYKAKMTFADGTQNTVDLPVPEIKGIILQVKDTLGKTSVNIICNKAYFQENQGKDVNLVMYSQGRLSTVNTKLDNRVMGMDIAKDQFSSGILQVTLFSHDGEPLSERLVFLKNADLLNIAVNSNKPVYKVHDKAVINFNAKSNNTNSPGFFSVAVVDESRVPFDDNNETTILSYLLLTSDLKGYIEQPNYYFTSNNKQVQNDLDNLVLTQGYRKFSWKQLLNSDIKPFTYAPEKDLYIMGSEKTSGGEPVVNKDVILMQEGSVLGTAKTNNTGGFLFDMPPFYAGSSFTLQAAGSTKDKNSTIITVEKQPDPTVINNAFDSLMSRSAMYPAGNNTGNALANNAANSEQTIDGDEISGATSLTLALSGRLNSLNFVSGVPYLKGVKYPVLIVIDGKIRNSYINLDGVAPSNVKAVQLLKGASASSYGSSGSSGVLIINTRYGITSAAINEQNNVYKYEAQNVVKKKDYTTGTNNISYRSSNIGGPGHADQVVSGDAFKNTPNLPTGLNGLLHGIQFVSGVPYIRGNSIVGVGQDVPMYIVLDGTPINATLFGDIDPRSIETVEVLKGPSAAIYGMNGAGGVLVLTTRIQVSEDAQTIGSSLGTLQFKPVGFYKAREFYSPKYDASSSANGPDVRSTLYWNPNIVTDNDGNASFEFYNSDGHGSVRVIVEGIDVNGNLGRQVYRYKVE